MPTAEPPPPRSDRNLYAVFGVTLMAVLGVSSVTPAFPAIAEALHRSPQAIGLLISAFTLPGAILTPVVGVVADRLGRKVLLIPALLLFGVAGTACGLARDFHLLVGLRLLQGTGAAGLGALNMTIVGDLYSGERRATVMGYNATVLGIGTGLYPAIGGALATIAWFVPFFLPLLALPVAWMTLHVLHNPEPVSEQPLGAYLHGAAALLRSGAIWVPLVASVGGFVLLYGAYLAYLPFLMGQAFQASSLAIGLTMSLTSAATAGAAFHLGRLTTRFGGRRLVCMGFVAYGVALAAFPLARQAWMLIPPALLYGVGNGINNPSIVNLLAEAAPASQRGIVMALNSTLRRIGQTVGPVLVGVAVPHVGLHAAFYGSAVLAAGVLLVLVAGFRGRPQGGEVR